MKKPRMILMKITAVLCLSISFLFIGCAGNDPAPKGTSSGGGGFIYPNAKKLLEDSSQELAFMLRVSSPGIYQKMPKGWSPERLAKVIENVQMNHETTERRHGKDLLFNYDKSTETISALQPFFLGYASVPIHYLDVEEARKIKKDVHRQLLHEAVHLFDVGTSDNTDILADRLAQEIIHALYNDSFVCNFDSTVLPKSTVFSVHQDMIQPEEEKEDSEGILKFEKIEPKTNFAIHRTFADAVIDEADRLKVWGAEDLFTSIYNHDRRKHFGGDRMSERNHVSWDHSVSEDFLTLKVYESFIKSFYIDGIRSVLKESKDYVPIKYATFDSTTTSIIRNESIILPLDFTGRKVQATFEYEGDYWVLNEEILKWLEPNEDPKLLQIDFSKQLEDGEEVEIYHQKSVKGSYQMNCDAQYKEVDFSKYND